MRLFRKQTRQLLFRSFLGVVLVGLLVLNIRSVRREPPTLRVGEISPRMNFSTVRIQGILESAPRRLGDGSVLYMVDDGTGILPVFLTQLPSGDLPSAGSRIVATGVLSVGAGHNIRLRVRSVDDVACGSVEPPLEFLSDTKLSDITAEQQGDRITVYGMVSRIWHPTAGSKAPHKITLADPGGSLEVVHWFEPKRVVALGDELKIRGTVDPYNGHLQLKVWEADDIRILARRGIYSDL